MTLKTLRHLLKRLSCLSVSACVMAGCSHLSDTSPWPHYYAAIEKAAVVDTRHIHTLTPLIEEKVTLVEWADQTSYALGPHVLAEDLWVTVVPDVLARCQDYDTTSPEALTLRLQQLLGLPPKPVVRSEFVVMRVARDDVFRPCPDPDPTTAHCEWDFPEDIPEAYVNWFARALLKYYQIPDGYPFTRLGYTYDWHPDTPRVGVSEYVIRRGAEVEVIAITPAAWYCHPDHKIAFQS